MTFERATRKMWRISLFVGMSFATHLLWYVKAAVALGKRPRQFLTQQRNAR